MWTKKAIGKNLRRIRRARKMTQIDLGEAAGLAPNSISKWEAGDAMPESGSLCALCNALNCTPNDLMWEENENG